MTKIFISYSSHDRIDALEIKSLLEAHDCEVWLDFFDIQPTAQLAAQLSDNVKQADVVCLLLSPTSVASKWVGQEIEHALAASEHGLRILPVILRPCAIPDSLNNIVGIDATAGLKDEAVQSRLIRAVSGGETVKDAVLLDQAFRKLMADKEVQLTASQDFPSIAEELNRVRQEPIRELRISVDPDAFPLEPRAILELRLNLDPLWTEPMSFFFAGFVEGKTWPDEFGFSEPPYTQYFTNARPRIDGKFQWFDRVENLNQTIDGTDLEDQPAGFSLELDGSEFQPGGSGIHLAQKFEIPSIMTLTDKNSSFQMIAHYPDTKTSQMVDLNETDIDIRVQAYFHDHEPSWCTLFRSSHDPLERVILGCDYMREITNAIGREALLGLYPPLQERARISREEKFARIEKALQEENFDSDDDRRLAARLSYSRASLAVFQGQHQAALEGYYATARILDPLVFKGDPNYRDCILIYQACAQLVGFFLKQKNFTEAGKYSEILQQIAQQLQKVDPKEPDFKRLLSDAMLKNAIIQAETGDTVKAGDELGASVEILRQLSKELNSPSSLVEAVSAMKNGLELAQKWGILTQEPFPTWQKELAPAETGQPGGGGEGGEKTALPVWLQSVQLEGWPTQEIQNPMLRYSLRIRQGWDTTPQVNATQMEIEHIYRGKSPANWLIVSAMDSAVPTSDMKNWVEAVLGMTGFPVLAMQQNLNPPPELIDWRYEGQFPRFSEMLGVDEVHAYTGMAKIPGNIPLLSHIYILMARRKNFAWKVTLAFESAVLPGMPENMIATNDHVRAGATFGSLRFLTS